jgi:hypothetical protein
MENEMRKHINQVKYFGKKIVNEGYKGDDYYPYYPYDDLKSIATKVKSELNELRDDDGGPSSSVYNFMYSLDKLFDDVMLKYKVIDKRRMEETDKEQKRLRMLGVIPDIGHTKGEDFGGM